MEKVFRVLNEMERAGIVARYAIGGAMAATFYVEPILTYDLDIFFTLADDTGGLTILSPIYEYLRDRGFIEEREHVIIHGMPVQFLPAFNALITEAVEDAAEKTVDDVTVRVLRAEHLVVIMLQTFRAKDKARIVQMMEEATVDEARLSPILARHGLSTKWRAFCAEHGIE